MPAQTPFLRTSPEAEGIPSAAVLSFVQALEQPAAGPAHPLDAVHSFMLLRHGRVAAEGWWAPYRANAAHILYSLSKSFTSTAIGLAVAEGRLSVDDPVLDFFPGDAPASPSPHLQAMRVRHLLSMNTGHEADTTDRVFGCRHDNWPAAFLALPVKRAPGSWFVYNTAATYMLSAIITKLTGQPLLEYLRPRLFDPLGIANPTWETDPRGVNLGGTGLHITTEDIARFGQMYLQGGEWQGRQIVPAAWIAEATHAHSDNSNTGSSPDWSVGYGYQFWRCRHDAYRGDGAFGQYCIVLPAQDAVLAINSGLRDMQAVLDKVWAHLLPAFGPAPLPADPAAHDALCAKLAALALPLPAGATAAPAAAPWAGRTYKLDHTPLPWGRTPYYLQRIALHPGDEGGTLVVTDARGQHPIAFGYGAWLPGSSDLRGELEPTAAAAAWPAPDTCEVRLCFTAGEFCPVLRLHFSGDELQLEIDPNVAWDTPVATKISGRAEHVGA